MAKAKDKTSNTQRNERGIIVSTGSSDFQPLLNEDGTRAKRKKTAGEESQERLEKQREERREAKKQEKEAKEAAKKAAEEQAQTPAAKRSLIREASETANEEAPLKASVSISEVKKAENEAAGRDGDTGERVYTTDMFTGGFNHAGGPSTVTAKKPRVFDVQKRGADDGFHVFSPMWVDTTTGEAKAIQGEAAGSWVKVSCTVGKVQRKITLGEDNATVEYSLVSAVESSTDKTIVDAIPITFNEPNGRMNSALAGAVAIPLGFARGIGDIGTKDENDKTYLVYYKGFYRNSDGTFTKVSNEPVKVELPAGGGGGGRTYIYGPLTKREEKDENCSATSTTKYGHYVGYIETGTTEETVDGKNQTVTTYTFKKVDPEVFVEAELPPASSGGSSWGYGPVEWDSEGKRFVQYKGTFSPDGTFKCSYAECVFEVVSHAGDHIAPIV